MESYLVIGGSGFLGRHIVQQLKARGDEVSVLDIVQRYDDTPFYSVDISDETQVADALQKSGATCIIHTASPPHGLDPAIYFKVNVDGTRAVLAAAALPTNRVDKLVFTSSAGVVFNGEDIIDVDERLAPPEVAMDAYNESKSRAEELVLKANGVGGVKTVALRPAGIFGPGDRQVMTGLYQVYERGQTHFQIGDNNNLFDWTYVSNVAHAHLLAADKLAQEPSPPSLDNALPSIDLTTGKHNIPTSNSRPLGPYVTLPPNAEKIEANFNSSTPVGPPRPVRRTRFDPLSANALARADPDYDPLAVAGNVFFITNGEPVYFWDFMRYVWHALDQSNPSPPAKKRQIVFPKTLGMALAGAAEWWGWLTGRESAFTRFRVQFSCATRWHNIEKARRVLGYEPQVGIEEGVKRMVEWWREEHAKGNIKTTGH